MQLLSVIRARSIWLIDILDLNPKGRHIESSLIEWMQANYHFMKYPASIPDFNQGESLTFAQGSFEAQDGLISVDLTIHRDGLVAETRSSTKDTDAFIEEVLRLAVQDFGLVYHPEMIRQKHYVSELNVSSQYRLNRLNPRLQAFADRITSMLGNVPGTLFEPASISFWADPSAPFHYSHFVFERKVNTPFSEHRYYSRAPLHTIDHLKLLEEFEDLLIG
jgi:hypothetical protein